MLADLSLSYLDILLLLYPLSIALIFYFNPRAAVLILFGGKFTIDLFWEHRFLGFNLNILQIVGILFPVLCAFIAFKNRNEILRHPFFRIVFYLFISNLIASLWGWINNHWQIFELVASPLTLKHIAEWNFRFANLAGAFLCIPVLFNRKNDFDLLFRIFTLSTIPAVLIGLIEYTYSFKNIDSSENFVYSVKAFYRLTAGYHDSAVYATILFTGFSGAFYFWNSTKKNPYQWLWCAYFFITVLLLFHTYSRTFWITAVLFLIVFYFLQKQWFFITIVSLFVVIGFLFSSSVQKRFHQEISYLKKENTEYLTLDLIGTGRIGLWKQATDHYYRLDFVSKCIGSGGAYGSHNQYIAFLLKNGLIGIIIFFFFLISIGFDMYNKIKKDTISNPSTKLIFSLFLSVTIFGNQFIQIWDHISFDYFFWSICGITVYSSKTFSNK